MPKRPPFFLVAILLAMIASGCSEKIEMGTVSGKVVSAKGDPLDSVRVYFMPNFAKQTEGRASWAITDEQGNFTLEYQGGDNGPGAAIGWHKVTLEDIAGENFRDGPPPPVRVPKVYMSPATTPLEYEVIPGDQIGRIPVGRSANKTQEVAIASIVSAPSTLGRQRSTQRKWMR